MAAKITLPVAHPDAITLSHFIVVLRGLIGNVSKLDGHPASTLVSAVLRFRWLDLSAETRRHPDFPVFLDTYSQFINVLISSFPKYLHDVVKKLVKEFPDVTGVYPHHAILERLVAYSPTCVSTIPPVLARNFPHHLSALTKDIFNYVRNCMQIVRYCPDLRFSVWQMVVECCIKLDVELQNELDDLDDDLIEELIADGEDEIDENVSEDDEEGVEVYAASSTTDIKRLVAKLDTTLEYLLESTAGSFSAEELQSGSGVPLFNTLTSLFKTHILPTYYTKLVQYILFHVLQYQPELADLYLVLLIDVAFSSSEMIEKRLKALQYLSLYIARAKNLSRHQVVFMASYLIGWINKYITEREHEVTALEGTGMERFKLFYATFQALLYIFCFRHQLLALDSGWECDIDKFFQRVIIAKFNPLKYCDETVVYIFAKLATRLNVCYCYSIIEHNKRERMTQSRKLPSAVGTFRHKQEFLDLEAYFPFDPMVLPACKKIISANYIEWSDVNPANDDDDDDESGSHTDDAGNSDSDITSEDDDDE